EDVLIVQDGVSVALCPDGVCEHFLVDAEVGVRVKVVVLARGGDSCVSAIVYVAAAAVVVLFGHCGLRLRCWCGVSVVGTKGWVGWLVGVQVFLFSAPFNTLIPKKAELKKHDKGECTGHGT